VAMCSIVASNVLIPVLLIQSFLSFTIVILKIYKLLQTLGKNRPWIIF